jgi:PAS domain S-box-containing protein
MTNDGESQETRCDDGPDVSARTMRIDIHPDFAGEDLARKKAAATQVGRSEESSAILAARLQDRRSSDYGNLLESIYDGVLIADYKGRIIDFNSRATDFFLTDEQALRGRKAVDLISGADESLLASIRRNLRQHRYTLIEAYCVRRDQTKFPAEIAVNKIQLDQETRFCFFIRDISVRKRAQEALEEAVARLEEHDKARLQFVSNVSHELRTPLTSMIYAVDNMLRGVVGPIPDKVRDYLNLLRGDCKRLLGTVNDILDMRKLDSKTLALALTRVPLARFVRRSAESLRVQAERKNLALEISSRDHGLFADCDPQKMERVILNLVGNAIKFTPDGGRIEVVVARDPARDGYARIAVEDTGIGIPAEALKRVTERYFTVVDQPMGTGLGLSISKEIVELHNGAMTVESPPPGRERGTVVTVSLPTAAPPVVLMADDDAGVLDVMESHLRKHGYATVRAADGEEALARIAQAPPDLAILDLAMPKLDGNDVIMRMKSDKNMMRIPILVVSGVHLGREGSELLRNFSVPALRKPWKEQELLDSLEEAFLGKAAFGGQRPSP